MAKANKRIKMVIDMKVNGKIINFMATEFSSIKMVTENKANNKKINILATLQIPHRIKIIK